jgi:starvation-inducible DNA-binding protein
MDINIGIMPNNRDAVAKILNILLSDEYILLIKTKNYHWNVTGMNFNDLHLFFDKQYAELTNITDEIAERIRALGTHSFGTIKEFIEYARLKEEPGKVPSDKEMIRNLLHDHEEIIKLIRKDIDKTIEFQDIGTNNFLSDLIEKHEKMAWMLRSYLA